MSEDGMYRALFDEAPLGILVATPCGTRFLHANPAMCRMLGYSLEEIRSRGVKDIHPAEALPMVLSDFAAMASEKMKLTPSIPVLRKDGSVFFADISAAPLRMDGGPAIIGFFIDVTERQRAEALAEESFIIHRRMCENSPLGMHFYSLVGNNLIFAGANAAADTLLGLDNTQFIGMKIEEAFPNLVGTEVPMRYRLAASDNVAWHTEQITYKDEQIQGAFEVRAFQTSPGNMVALFDDITARKRAEAELLENQMQLRVLSDNIPGGLVYQIDSGMDGRERRFTYVSKGVEDLHGITQAEALADSRAIYRQVVEDDIGSLIALESKAFESLRPLRAETRIRMPSGELRWRLFASAPRRQHDGRVIWDGVEVDITDRKRAEAGLVEANEQLQMYLDLVNTVIVAIGPDQRIMRMNRWGCSLMGYTEEELIGRNWFDTFIAASDRATVKAVFEKLMLGEMQPVEYFENEVVTKRGETRLIAWHNTLLKDASGAILGTLSSGADVTEHRKAERERERLLELEQAARIEAEQAVKSRDEFLSIAAHDLNTPLGALQLQLDGMNRQIREKGISEESLSSGMSLLARQSHRLIRLVRRLLSLSRIRSGRLSVRRSPCDLGNIVRDVCERLMPEIRKAGCDLRVNAASASSGMWDGELVEQIIENLLGNAIKFGQGKPITIDVVSAEESTVMTMSSGGAGISETMAERIFEAYDRGPASSHLGGMGMGLFISRQIAMAHGGTLAAVSRPDVAVFELKLPRG